MSRLDKVIAHVKSCGVKSSWLRSLKTEKDALRLIDDVIEGDFDPETQFDQAFEAFQRHFKSYTIYISELDEERDLGDVYEY